MTGFLDSLTGLYQGQIERHKNRPFLKAIMAASAMVAVSDGAVTFNQRMRVDQILETLEALKAFDPHEGVDLFNDYVDAIRASSKDGHAKALADIHPVAQKSTETAALLLRVCLAICEANGEINLVEQIEIVTLCSLLDVDPSDCGLYIDMSVDEFLAEAGRHIPRP
jgi:tellurite resistance protein TerB